MASGAAVRIGGMRSSSPASKPRVGLHPLAVDPNFAAAQDSINVTFGNPFEIAQQEIVDTLPGARLPHCKAVHSILA